MPGLSGSLLASRHGQDDDSRSVKRANSRPSGTAPQCRSMPGPDGDAPPVRPDSAAMALPWRSRRPDRLLAIRPL